MCLLLFQINALNGLRGIRANQPRERIRAVAGIRANQPRERIRAVAGGMIKHLEIQLANELAWVDRYLYMVVDPDLRKLDIEYLVQNFDYPDVDLKKVDGDNL